jgi:formamidopyrimidine-DNA glycosylase
VPELPEVEAVRRTLDRAMRGMRIVRVQLRRPDLRRPFPKGFAARLTGRRITAVNRRGKYLLAPLDSGEALIVHLGMSGSFEISRRHGARAVRRLPIHTITSSSICRRVRS